MSRLPLSRSHVIYNNHADRVTIYKGLLSDSIPVAVKEQVFNTLREANAVIQEAMAMSSLTHENILRLFDCEIVEGDHGCFKTVLVMELLDRDVGEEIRVRKDSNSPWSDWELIQVLKALVSALSFAQRHGVSHRDIKPCNIMTNGSVFKLGDFGSTARNLHLSNIRRTIQGSPFFLSPELKREYANMLQTGVEEASYDPVKSDVYSLGVTMVEMASLKQPTQLVNLKDLQEETYKLIVGLSEYPFLQPFLTWMLEEDPDKRPNFIDIEAYLLQYADFYANGFVQPQECVAIVEERKDVPGFVQFPPETFDANQAHRFVQSADKASIHTCAVCSNPIVFFKVPKKLNALEQYASMVCSAACLRSMDTLVGTTQCAYCPCMERSPRAIVLKCEHWFHDKNCLFTFMLEASECFASKITYECPVCTKKISYKATILPMFEEEELEDRKREAKRLYCAECRKVPGAYEWKGKLYCESCNAYR